jgi:hypothetical protein
MEIHHEYSGIGSSSVEVDPHSLAVLSGTALKAAGLSQREVRRTTVRVLDERSTVETPTGPAMSTVEGSRRRPIINLFLPRILAHSGVTAPARDSRSTPQESMHDASWRMARELALAALALDASPGERLGRYVAWRDHRRQIEKGMPVEREVRYAPGTTIVLRTLGIGLPLVPLWHLADRLAVGGVEVSYRQKPDPDALASTQAAWNQAWNEQLWGAEADETASRVVGMALGLPAVIQELPIRAR